MSQFRKRSNDTLHIADAIRICGRSFALISDRQQPDGGGSFHLCERGGRGAMRIHTGPMKDPGEIWCTLIHETIEAITTEDKKRYEPRSEDDKRLFVFDHDYLDTMCYKLVDALASCGAIKIPKRFKFDKVQAARKRRTGDANDGDNKKSIGRGNRAD